VHEFSGKRKEKELKKVDWYENLFQLNQYYNFKEFVNQAVVLPAECKNLELVYRILDIIELIG